MSSHREIIEKSLGKRYSGEIRFRYYGLAALSLGVLFLGFLLVNTLGNAYTAIQQTYMALDVDLSEQNLGLEGEISEESINSINYNKLVKDSMYAAFPEVSKRGDKRALTGLVSSNAQYTLRNQLIENPELIGTTHRFWVLADDEVDMFMKGKVDRDLDEQNRRLKNRDLGWIDEFVANDQLEKRFNFPFFTNGDSREPEQAGILGALMGSLFAILVTMLLAFPIGVAAAVYLEEFAPKNRFTDLIEVNINNLAAVPSIIFGLLGLAIFLNFFGMPRSIPLVGGMVLALMTLPTIIISSRAALAAVPPSIREAALGIGASPVQTVLHHVLPLAMPGMLTGSIIGLAQALGETAPLLVIGMVAFIVDVPTSPLDPGTALPVQIYLWSDSPERAFVERTSAAIMVLLLLLIAINGLIVLLRKKLERRW